MSICCFAFLVGDGWVMVCETSIRRLWVRWRQLELNSVKSSTLFGGKAMSCSFAMPQAETLLYASTVST